MRKATRSNNQPFDLSNNTSEPKIFQVSSCPRFTQSDRALFCLRPCNTARPLRDGLQAVVLYVAEDVPAPLPYLGPVLLQVLSFFPRKALIFTIAESYFFIVAVVRKVCRIAISYRASRLDWLRKFFFPLMA